MKENKIEYIQSRLKFLQSLNAEMVFKKDIEDIRHRRVHCDGRILNSAFKRIPAITGMSFSLGNFNEILLMFGLKRRLPTQFDFDSHRENMKMNGYMTYNIKRLRKMAQTDPKKF